MPLARFFLCLVRCSERGTYVDLQSHFIHHHHHPRLKEIVLTLSDEEQLGLIIVGGLDSPNGNLPIYIKKVVPEGVASKDGRLSEGDQLLAVNDKILLECSKDYAVDVLRKAKGKTRLLVIQDY